MRQSSVEKALTILMAFAPYNQEMGSIELSRRLRLHNSTVNRLLHVLTSFGLLQQNPETKKFSLGRSVADLGRAINQSISARLISIAQPHMERLRDLVGESISLEVMNGDHVTLAFEALGPPPLSVSFNVGELVPVYAAAGAKSILAFLPPESVDRFLNGEFTKFTPNTITDPDILKGQFKEIRRQGIAFDLGEYNIDVYAVAAPIFNYNREPVAAISLCGPVNRMKFHLKSDVISKLKKTAAKISERLLYSEEDG